MEENLISVGTICFGTPIKAYKKIGGVENIASESVNVSGVVFVCNFLVIFRVY